MTPAMKGWEPLSKNEWTIRLYEPSDREAMLALRERHDTSFWFADPDDPINFETWLVFDGDKLVASFTCRHTIEAFVMLDKSHGTPADRWDMLQTLYNQLEHRGDELGIRECHINIPKKLRGYARRLLKMPQVFYDDRLHMIAAVFGRLGG